jgi:hypothetical protein
VWYSDGAEWFDLAATTATPVDPLDLTVVAPGTPPANTLRMFHKRVAGRSMPSFVGAQGGQSLLQPSLFDKDVQLWRPPGNSTAINVIGGVIAAAGTVTNLIMDVTSKRAATRGVDALITTAAVNAIAGFRGSAIQYFRGQVPGRGGWFQHWRWGNATGAATASNRAFCGMMNTASAPTDVQPSTLLNMCGFGWDAADANIQFMSNDGAGAAAKIDLGASFPVPTVDRSTLYECATYCAPNGSEIFYWFRDVLTGEIAEGSVTTKLPVNTIRMAPQLWMSAGGTSSVIGVSLFSHYTETDI